MKKQIFNLPADFTYTAHTGCVKTEDNSLESIETGYGFGADIIEIDLHFLPDGTPVLSHDKPKGDEISLEEAFKKIREYEKLKVNVDVKSVDNLQAIYPLAQKYGLENRIFYTGVHSGFVDAVKNDSPEIAYYLNASVKKPRYHTEDYLQSLVDEVKNSGAIGINFNKKGASKKLVDIFRKNGLLVSIWTVNEKRKMLKNLSLSPDNITTRRPDKMKKILK